MCTRVAGGEYSVIKVSFPRSSYGATLSAFAACPVNAIYKYHFRRI